MRKTFPINWFVPLAPIGHLQPKLLPDRDEREHIVDLWYIFHLSEQQMRSPANKQREWIEPNRKKIIKKKMDHGE